MRGVAEATDTVEAGREEALCAGSGVTAGSEAVTGSGAGVADPMPVSAVAMTSSREAELTDCAAGSEVLVVPVLPELASI